MKGMCYLPVVGAIVGVLVSQVFDLGSLLWELPIVAAVALSTAVSLKITGCLHEDGLADTADGMGGGWTREQILKIMSDSRLGTFGSAALILYIFTKLQLLAALGSSRWEIYDFVTYINGQATCFSADIEPNLLSCGGSQGAGPALIVAHTLARLTAPYLIWRCDYIQDSGPKSNFYSFMIRAKFLVSLPRIFFSLLFCYGLTAALYGPQISTQLIIGVWICAECAGIYGRKKLEGVMGDFLGGTICFTELFIYASLAGGSILETVKLCFQALMNRNNYSVLEGEKPRLFLRFASMAILYQVWCWLVVLIERKYEENELKKEIPDEKIIKTSKEKSASSSPQKESAQNVLKSSTATIMDKHNAVQEYLDILAKPVGSLGTLEEWAARICVLQSSLTPNVDAVSVIIFAGDHGVTAAKEDGGEGCSLYPQVVTRAILEGLQQNVGGASVLANGLGLNLNVVDVGVVGDPYTGKFVNSARNKLSKGTRNFCLGPAMTMEEVDRCLNIGRETIAQAVKKESCRVVALGEVGIGNTTTASTLIAALTKIPVEELCDGGAFASHTADNDKIKKKIEIVERALKKHMGSLNESYSILSKVGGSEIAALVGAMIEASDRNVAVLVDGFIVTAAALVAVRMKPSVCNVLFLTTKSAEKGQQAAIEEIQAIAKDHNIPVPASPVLSMGLRMGEGTGAILAVPILQSSAAMITNMATIQDILS
mmetsp:Transcript_24434/g.51614  ORF Transcript_24434/g.51614 Transcript_24434/m.51614 type:complete len:713 (+) Transcript_24434:318-2456(+)